jgi:hypothetical protein
MVNQDGCTLCGGTDDEGLVLLCDTCDRAYHAHCVGFVGPLKGDWCCHACVQAASGAYEVETRSA